MGAAPEEVFEHEVLTFLVELHIDNVAFVAHAIAISQSATLLTLLAIVRHDQPTHICNEGVLGQFAGELDVIAERIGIKKTVLCMTGAYTG